MRGSRIRQLAGRIRARGALAAARIVDQDKRRLALWVPVLLGSGICAYFVWPSEPPGAIPPFLFGLAGVLFLLAAMLQRAHRALGTALIVPALLALGFLLAQQRTVRMAAPVIEEPVSTELSGRIRAIDSTRSGAPRLTLDSIRMAGTAPGRTPRRLRVSLFGEATGTPLAIGARVRMKARLFPPPEPSEPAAQDFRFLAWFTQLGGTGYTRAPLIRLPAAEEANLFTRLHIAIDRWRWQAAAALRAQMPDEQGAIAAALMVGVRIAMPEKAMQDLRNANLAHLLAISGLHMGLVAGMVFAMTRFCLALFPSLSARRDTRRIAAILAFLAASLYLVISGASLPTQRAWIMVTVPIGAILLDRPALTLRALALAATLILLWRPESLAHVGFQLSFAATTALVAFHDSAHRRWRRFFPSHSRGARLASWFLALLASALVAGAATSPYAAFHFGRVTPYGLLANPLALPIMGFWIAPWGIAAGLASLAGLEEWPLKAMGAGIAAILRIAETVAGLEGAERLAPAGELRALHLISLGGLWLCLWKSPLRWAGLFACLAGIWLWAQTPRPDILIAPEATLVGVLGERGRTLDRARGEAFAARMWLERDGDRADQRMAASRGGLARAPGLTYVAAPNGWRIIILYAKRNVWQLMRTHCRARTLLLVRHANAPPEGARRLRTRERFLHEERGCVFAGGSDLRRLGAIAIYLRPGGLEILHDGAGRRLWEMAGATRSPHPKRDTQ